jgi:hypothetical protein
VARANLQGQYYFDKLNPNSEAKMSEQLQPTADRNSVKVSLSGFDLINSPRLNKGTAFTDHERDQFELHGLLPPHVGSLDEQIERRLEALRAQPNSFSKYSFLRDLQDTNETVFYALLARNIEVLSAEERNAIATEGGLRGGRARADSLTKARRSEIAKKAAESRWAKVKKGMSTKIDD